MYSRRNAKLMTALIPILVSILYLNRDRILSFIIPRMPPCYFHSLLHVYCPSCGNTRSVIALLQGNLFTSLRYNLLPLLFLILFLLAYIELAAYSFGKKIRLVPRGLVFYLTLIILLCLYWVIRNFIPYLTP